MPHCRHAGLVILRSLKARPTHLLGDTDKLVVVWVADMLLSAGQVSAQPNSSDGLMGTKRASGMYNSRDGCERRLESVLSYAVCTERSANEEVLCWRLETFRCRTRSEPSTELLLPPHASQPSGLGGTHPPPLKAKPPN
jgi:hypothetical protein